MGKPRIILVDDDPLNLELTAEILKAGSEADVIAIDNTLEALRLVVNSPVDMLVTDLHIQHACDGLLLSTAVRRCHPQAFTVLMTGMPDFLGAVSDMQRQLDRVLVKPLGREQLQSLSTWARDSSLRNSSRQSVAGKATIWELVAAHQAEIIEAWFQQVTTDSRLAGPSNMRDERLDHLPTLLATLPIRVPKATHGEHVSSTSRSPEEREASRKHGRVRRMQGYLPHWVSLETSYLRQGIVRMVMNEMLNVDLPRLQADMLELYECLDESLLDSLEAFGLEGM